MAAVSVSSAIQSFADSLGIPVKDTDRPISCMTFDQFKTILLTCLHCISYNTTTKSSVWDEELLQDECLNLIHTWEDINDEVRMRLENPKTFLELPLEIRYSGDRKPMVTIVQFTKIETEMAAGMSASGDASASTSTSTSEPTLKYTDFYSSIIHKNIITLKDVVHAMISMKHNFEDNGEPFQEITETFLSNITFRVNIDGESLIILY
jgi:hypothetical protein